MPAIVVVVPVGTVDVVPEATSVEIITDHVERALNRRCQQFRFDEDDED